MVKIVIICQFCLIFHRIKCIITESAQIFAFKGRDGGFKGQCLPEISDKIVPAVPVYFT